MDSGPKESIFKFENEQNSGLSNGSSVPEVLDNSPRLNSITTSSHYRQKESRMSSNVAVVVNGLSKSCNDEELTLMNSNHSFYDRDERDFESCISDGVKKPDVIGKNAHTYVDGYSERIVVHAEELDENLLKDLFDDKICVLRVKNFVSGLVCDQMDKFLREKGRDAYTHEIRKDGKLDMQYFGVHRYGYPLNTAYNATEDSIYEYLSKALPTLRSIRAACSPYLSPIDKFRVEMDEVWSRKVNIATLKDRKTFCGIGRIMPSGFSELSEEQPHFDAVPTKFFPSIHKQFTANFYMHVPDQGGELEIWNVKPMDIGTVEKFTIPDNWRMTLPRSYKVKPEQGDLLMFNTRRPHAITRFEGPDPRTSIQTFIGYTKDADVFFWV